MFDSQMRVLKCHECKQMTNTNYFYLFVYMFFYFIYLFIYQLSKLCKGWVKVNKTDETVTTKY